MLIVDQFLTRKIQFQYLLCYRDEHLRFYVINVMGYLKNVDTLATLNTKESLAFIVPLLNRILDSNNYSQGTMLFELLRCLSNLSEISQHQESLVRAGIIKSLSRIVKGKLVERLHWKPSDHNDEYCSFEKALATKCLYSYAIHPEFSKIVLADEPLLIGNILLFNHYNS